MNELKAVLIDDEEKARRGLKNLLEKFCPQIVITGEAEDIEEAYELILKIKPDVIFLDIQMPNGNGFNLLRKFNSLPFEVIFVTGYDSYAINAIKFRALDYLLKPVAVEQLKEAAEKAFSKKAAKGGSKVQILNLLNSMEDKGLEKNIAVHHKEKVAMIKVGEIEYITSNDRYSHIHTRSGEKYTITKTLKEFEEYLTDNPVFLHISKT